ncbi:Retrovirus-related Pol polyprotein from transposon TNT 1-94 [Vitis vinifera]|uniref:Retrovirus-related Pol polyprotein from transposon TNT 1-94 n=1 Tax=Vitis vinifera TaxID=29760 RepID=A0A438KL59_VITVI|nr:Retrovirus-related Pol polyprotein from transposon TNT 1-94 [Vitis vinifera]
MPTNYWGEAITTAAYLINRVPSSSLQFQTPFDVLHHTVSAPTIPNMSPKVFGCVAFVYLQKGLRTKLEPRALRCVFVGYALHKKGENGDEVQTLQHPLDNLDFISGDNLETSGECPSDGNREEYPGENETGGDGSKGPEFFDDKNQGQMEVQDQIEVLLASHDVPANQLSSPTDFMLESHSPTDSLHESHVNSEFEPRLKVLPNRVTRGKPKVSYEPILNSKSKHPINNYVSYHRLSKESMTFVNQLSVVSIPNNLQEALKDSKWRWVFTIKYKADGTIERCKTRLVAKGYTQTYGIDYMEIFAPVAKINIVRILLSLAVNLDWPLHQFDVKNAFLHGNLQEEVYMELPPRCNRQTEVIGNDFEERNTLQKHLTREFEMKDLGELKYFLGIEVSRSKKDILMKRRLVGRLMYLAHTRPDLAYAPSVVSQFIHSPSEEHMNAVIRILRYLKSSPGKGILFTKGDSLDIKDQLANVLTKAVSSQAFNGCLERLGMSDIYAPT